MSSTSQHHTITDELLAIVGGLVGGAKYGIKIRLPHAFVMTTLFRSDLSTKQKLLSIFTLVKEHATNLAAFATIYKSILLSLKYLSRYIRKHPLQESPSYSRRFGRYIISLLVDGPFPKGTHSLPKSMAGHPERPYHSLVAGFVGGYYVWGRYSSVNQQIILYLTSRVLIGLIKKGYEHIHGGPTPAGGRGNNDHTNTTQQHSVLYNLLHSNQTYSLVAGTVWGIVMVLFEESPHVLHPSLRKSMDEIYRFQLSTMSSNVSE
jgi:peroxisomal membrane protein 4